MSIDRKTTKHIANLCRIDLDEKELEYFSSQLSKIVSYIAKINEIKAKDLPESFSAHTQTNVFREDKVSKFENREGLLKIFPASEDGFIKIPKVID